MLRFECAIPLGRDISLPDNGVANMFRNWLLS